MQISSDPFCIDIVPAKENFIKREGDQPLRESAIVARANPVQRSRIQIVESKVVIRAELPMTQ